MLDQRLPSIAEPFSSLWRSLLTLLCCHTIMQAGPLTTLVIAARLFPTSMLVPTVRSMEMAFLSQSP